MRKAQANNNMQTSGVVRALLSAVLQQPHARDGTARVCAAAAAAGAAGAQWWPSQLAAAGGPCQHQQQRHKHTVKMVLLEVSGVQAARRATAVSGVSHAGRSKCSAATPHRAAGALGSRVQRRPPR